MGKSTTLVAAALEAARRGGVVLFDPIGDVASSFRTRISDREAGRVVESAPLRAPYPLNALRATSAFSGPGPRAEKARRDLVAALRRVRAVRDSETSVWGPR